MLYFPQTRIEFSVDRPVAAGMAIPAEGCALVSDLTGGVFGVKASTGGAGEKFVGVSVSQPTTVSDTPKVEELKVAGGKVTLGKDPVGGTGAILVLNKATNAVIAYNATPAAGVYQITGREISVDASLNGVTLRVAYRFAPTLAEAMALQGNVLPGGPAGAYLGQVGVISRGDVYTDCFDTGANWNATGITGVKLAANGRFTPVTDTTNIPGIVIIELPSAARAFLGLNINASV